MDRLRISGGVALKGSVAANGSKNSGLKMLMAALLTADKVRISRVPHLLDVDTSLNLLKGMGVDASLSDHCVEINSSTLKSVEAPYDLVRTMRASILCLGPLLAREGKAKVSLPGGCAIGTRPVDLHLDGLRQLGAEITLEHGYILASVAGRLRGADIKLRFPSVGATENIMMAATLAEGTTSIANVAREPEIADLANFLNAMGAKVSGAGSDTITVEGVKSLHGCEYPVMFDRIEAATLLLAGAITGGKVTVTEMDHTALTAVLDKLEEAGIRVDRHSNAVTVDATGAEVKPVQIKTEPFPGFPTDVQAQFMALACQADGTTVFEENIFENRFMHVPELVRMGARIETSGNTAKVYGRPHCLHGATVMATDLRASASLVLAGLAAEKGETIVRRIYHLDRGYERIGEKLNQLGAKVIREEE